MKSISIVLSSLGFVLLVLALDAVKTHIMSRPQGFEASASIAVLFWIGIIVAMLGLVCCLLHLALKKNAPWRSGALFWCTAVLLGYGWIWFFPPRGL